MYRELLSSIGSFGIIFILICVVINTGFTAWLADEKGRNIYLWAFLGFIFGFIAFLAIGFAPNKNSDPKNHEDTAYNRTNLSHIEPIGNTSNSHSTTWVCKKCGTENLDTTNICKDCGTYK